MSLQEKLSEVFFSSLSAPTEEQAIEIIDFCIANGVDKDSRSCGKTLLAFAIEACMLKVIEHLVKIGASTTKLDNINRSIIHAAAMSKSIKCLKLCISLCPHLINETNTHGETPIFGSMIYFKSTEALDLLLAAGIDPNLVSNSGWSPLMTAATTSDPSKKDHIAALIKAGAKVDHKDHQGKTFVEVAHSRGYKDVAEILKGIEAEAAAAKAKAEADAAMAAIAAKYKPLYTKIQLSDGSFFKGSVVDGKPHEGVLKYSDGTKVPVYLDKDDKFIVKL